MLSCSRSRLQENIPLHSLALSLPLFDSSTFSLFNRDWLSSCVSVEPKSWSRRDTLSSCVSVEPNYAHNLKIGKLICVSNWHVVPHSMKLTHIFCGEGAQWDKSRSLKYICEMARLFNAGQMKKPPPFKS